MVALLHLAAVEVVAVLVHGLAVVVFLDVCVAVHGVQRRDGVGHHVERQRPEVERVEQGEAVVKGLGELAAEVEGAGGR